jgi:hypothetical protein
LIVHQIFLLGSILSPLSRLGTLQCRIVSAPMSSLDIPNFLIIWDRPSKEKVASFAFRSIIMYENEAQAQKHGNCPIRRSLNPSRLRCIYGGDPTLCAPTEWAASYNDDIDIMPIARWWISVICWYLHASSILLCRPFTLLPDSRLPVTDVDISRVWFNNPSV